MSVAALPAYLGQDFKDASPGMRFGMYLAIWTSRADQENEVRKRAGKKSHEGQEVQRWLQREGMDAAIAWLRQRTRNPLPGLWEKNDHGAREAWTQIVPVTSADRRIMEAIAERQAAMAQCQRDCLSLPACATAPFTTGLGNEHPLENGFAFLWPYGLPYLPGSGVKGVLRQAARELADGRWGDTRGWDETLELAVRKNGRETVTIDNWIDLLFGLEGKDHQTEHFRGLLTFWDVVPEIKGNRLMVEIMTPHQKHYYQDGQPPHDCGQPTPIQFLTVPPGSAFTFHVRCDATRLARIAPDPAASDKWRALLRAAFEHAFEWLGFGAKTAVGYGAMAVDTATLERHAEQLKARAREEAENASIAAATSNLPDDAKQLEQQRLKGQWKETNDFLQAAETFLDDAAAPSAEAIERLMAGLEERWPGILANPDATKGKKNKPKYKNRPRALARRLLEIRPNGMEAP